MFVLLVIVSAMKFYSFSEKKDGMEIIGGIIFGIMAIVYGFGLYGFVKNKKSINRGE